MWKRHNIRKRSTIGAMPKNISILRYNVLKYTETERVTRRIIRIQETFCTADVTGPAQGWS